MIQGAQAETLRYHLGAARLYFKSSQKASKTIRVAMMTDRPLTAKVRILQAMTEVPNTHNPGYQKALLHLSVALDVLGALDVPRKQEQYYREKLADLKGETQ